MAESQASYPVHLGVWTNWSLGGQVTGSTLTLTHRNGALLTAFLALYITFVGSRLWRLACFALHQHLLTDNTDQDALYHQLQAVLRNATDEKVAFTDLLRVLWAWRQRARHPFYRTVPIIAFTLLATISFMVASIFSSKISSTMGNQVLISSPDCGVWGATQSVTQQWSSEQLKNVFYPYMARKTYAYANYAQNCYQNTSDASNCNTFVKKRLASTVDRDADCPFHNQICRHGKGNIRLDTGHLNSQTDLGLNAPVDYQFDIRLNTHCATLKSKTRTVSQIPGRPYVQYFYGTPIKDSTGGDMPTWVYEVEQPSLEELEFQHYNPPHPNYSLTVRVCEVYNGTCAPDLSNFIPIDDFTPTDGDISLWFLSANSVLYSQPVDDDWYAAHRLGRRNITFALQKEAKPFYLADEPASVLGCKVQYQTCDPTLPHEQGCSPWGGLADRAFYITPTKTKRDRVIYWAFATISLKAMVSTLKESSLESRFHYSVGRQGPLPPTQWHTEVENWHDMALAALQASRIDTAVGPDNPEMLKYFWGRPSNNEEKYICKSQKINSTAYTNFSMMWLVVILVLGALIILLERSLESVIFWLERHRIVHISTASWFSNGTLQLQRMAHEELGLGDWDGCTGPQVVPITQTGQMLGILNNEDPAHPKLMNPHILSPRTESVDEKHSPDVVYSSPVKGSAESVKCTSEKSKAV